MALTDESSNGMVMPVAPMGGGGNGFGNDFGGSGWWILLLFLLIGGNGWGGFGGFGGGFAADGAVLYPWMNQSNQINDGFRDQMINNNVTEIRSGVTGLATQLCNASSDVQMALANGFAGVEQGANARQMANMQTAFANQTAMTQGFNQLGSQFADCCCENRLASADLKYTIATENCADRQALNEGVRDIISNQTAGIQRIIDKLCDQELQAERRDNEHLRSELMYARGQASQIEQTAQIRAGQNATMSALVNELRSCPIPSQPVYGSQPIFTCPNNNNGCGCGCGSF